MNWMAKAGIAGLTLAMAGCSSPDNRYYILSEAGSAARPAPVTGRAVTIEQISLPGYLDRPQIVVTDAENRVDIHEYERWAEPLDGMIRRILLADLTRQLGAGRVVNDASSDADSFNVTITAFGETTRRAILRGSWSLKSKTAPRPEHSFSVELPIATADTADTISALSQLLASLSADMAHGS